MVERLGDKACRLILEAKREVVIVAPYIKTDALTRLLVALGDSVDKLVCITRWLPEDIAAGVCDLGIMDIICGSYSGILLVQPHLHAKYYRADSQCLIGSANLTLRGLGWTTPANVELLVEIPYDFPGVKEWEENLRGGSINATPELRSKIEMEASKLRVNRQFARIPEVGGDQEAAKTVMPWVPRCSIPDYLWLVYSDTDSADLLQGTRDAATQDLAALELPEGLSEPLFQAYITSVMKQMPLMSAIDGLASRGLADSEAHLFLEEHLGDNAPYSAEQTWEVVKAWLVHFMGSSYRVEPKEDILIKGQRIVNLGT